MKKTEIAEIASWCEVPLRNDELDRMQASYKSFSEEDQPIYYRFLYHLSLKGLFLELGCRTGHASYHALTGSSSLLAIGVDKRAVVDHLVLAHPRFTFRNTLTLDPELVLSFQDASIDCILLDSSHKYEPTKQEFAAWWPKIKVGGLLLMDDILHEQYGCHRFWRELNLDKQEFEFLHPKGWGFGVIIKSS